MYGNILKDVLLLFHLILRSVSVLHTAKFVHRDIKPENFIFDNKIRDATSDNIDFPLLKICDFGIIKKQENILFTTVYRGTKFVLVSISLFRYFFVYFNVCLFIYFNIYLFIYLF
jgi:serine/threonine protein kinase